MIDLATAVGYCSFPAMSTDEGASALHKINVHILTRFIAVTILSYLDR